MINGLSKPNLNHNRTIMLRLQFIWSNSCAVHATGTEPSRQILSCIESIRRSVFSKDAFFGALSLLDFRTIFYHLCISYVFFLREALYQESTLALHTIYWATNISNCFYWSICGFLFLVSLQLVWRSSWFPIVFCLFILALALLSSSSRQSGIGLEHVNHNKFNWLIISKIEFNSLFLTAFVCLCEDTGGSLSSRTGQAKRKYQNW